MSQTSPPDGSATPNARGGGPSSGRYLPTLDGWRALAIIGVMTAHSLTYAWAKFGGVGVNIFFGISGFLICSRLLEEHRNTGRISLQAFYIRRSFRILPPYLTYLGMLAILTAAGVVVVGLGEFLTCLSFTRNYLPTMIKGSEISGGWYTAHFWSLAVEEHFYLIWPTFLVGLGVARARRLVVPLALAIGAWRMLEFRLQFLERVLPGVPFNTRTDTNLDGLLWGCWLAFLLDDPAWRGRLARWLNPVVWLALLVVFGWLELRQPHFFRIAEAVSIALLLAGTVLWPETPIGRVLEFEPLRWVGRLSYSLYLWQQLLLIDAPQYRSPGLWRLQSPPQNIVLVFACAAASFYLVEKPMIRLGHRISARYTGARGEGDGTAPMSEAVRGI